jgi:crossover junction endodeoxyribonuclease RuvC
VARRSSRALWTAALRDGTLPRARTTARPAPTTATARRGFRGVVLGVDPSLRASGLAVIDLSGPEPRLLESRTLGLPASAPPHRCLADLHAAVTDLIARHGVQAVALESTVYVQNLRTVAILGASRGAALAAAGATKVQVAEYAPSRIKQAVTGNGKAGKSQVAGMVASLLRLGCELPHDESDAAAVALCHGWTAVGSG